MLKQRSPMPRGKGFQRKQVAAPAPARSESVCGLAADEGPIEHQQVAALRPLRRGTYAHADMGIPVSAPKSPRAENAHLLSMARGKPCLIRSPICNYDPETTVACHGGGVASGKGMAYKVSDALTCWGCSACNHYTDAYAGATRQQKRDAFALGHLAQVCEWRAIAGSAAADPKDVAAARWALAHLNASPVGEHP